MPIDLCRLATAGVSSDDDDLVLAHGVHNVITVLEDGKILLVPANLPQLRQLSITWYYIKALGTVASDKKICCFF